MNRQIGREVRVDALSKLNFRDLGGIPVKGGAVRRGVLYRSEGPASFGDVHRAELVALGFRTVCDLRSAQEYESARNDWAVGIRLMNFDIIADLRARNDAAWSTLQTHPTVEGARQTMIANYRAMPAALAPHVRKLVVALAEGETPALVHCTAGKDRTGVLIALLLSLLGASKDDIRKDYLRSECFGRRAGAGDHIRVRFEKSLGYPPDDALIQVLLGVDPDFIDAALETVSSRWGSAESYFAAAGVDAVLLQAFSTVMVDENNGAAAAE